MRWLNAMWRVLREAATNTLEDDVMTMAAALAFYSALSLAPLLTLLLFVGGLFGEDTQTQLVGQLQAQVGNQASEAINQIIRNTNEQPTLRNAAGFISLGVLLFTAATVFAQLQAAMNQVWDAEPALGLGVWAWLRTRLLSMGLVLSMGFLLLVSMIVNSLLVIFGDQSAFYWQWLNNLLSLAVITVLFAAIFKVLPDVKLRWRQVWVGAVITAVLFTLGKYLIGLYLGNTAVGSSYGAAGSLVILLVWVYFSSIIVLFGAELTAAISARTPPVVGPTRTQ